MALLYYDIGDGLQTEEVGWFNVMNDGGLSARILDGPGIVLGPAVPFAVIGEEAVTHD